MFIVHVKELIYISVFVLFFPLYLGEKNKSKFCIMHCARNLFRSLAPQLQNCRLLSTNLIASSKNQSFDSGSICRCCVSRRQEFKRTIMTAMPGQDYLFRQLFDNRTFTYTYLLADTESKEAVIIDPVYELVDRDIHLVQDLGLKLKFALNTHVHADHVTGTGEIKQRIPQCRSVIAEPEAAADIHIKHGDVLDFGKFQLECRSTPGHTSGCTTFVWHSKSLVFTGDALLIRGCGRTDFQQGDAELLYKSVHGQILSLPDDFLLYPAHDYTGQSVTTVAEEKRLNPRLTKTQSQFVKVMEELNLPYPKYIDRALPANMVCGIFDQTPKS